jgi:hypothetical protein
MRAARNSRGVRQRTLYAAGTLPLACNARRALGVRRRAIPTHNARGKFLLFSFQRTFVSALHAPRRRARAASRSLIVHAYVIACVRTGSACVAARRGGPARQASRGTYAAAAAGSSCAAHAPPLSAITMAVSAPEQQREQRASSCMRRVGAATGRWMMVESFDSDAAYSSRLLVCMRNHE